MKDNDGDFNRYSPHYDPDENQVTMGLDYNGDWVHITRVRELAKERDEARTIVDFLKAANESDLRLLRATEAALDATHAIEQERDEARAEVERLTNERNQYRHLANLLLQAEEGYELRHVAEKQREACVQAAKNWARTQEQVAADKEGDSIWASAEMHRAESIMARRIAQAIQAAPLVTEAKS